MVTEWLHLEPLVVLTCDTRLEVEESQTGRLAPLLALGYLTIYHRIGPEHLVPSLMITGATVLSHE